MTHISVVSPVYKSENIIDELVRRLINELSKITHDFEIILVEDGSPDGSWQKILNNCKKDKRIKGIKLSRNFGQHYAITAGLDNADGNYVVVMDCDLQDKPEEIIRLYNKVINGYDCVFGKRIERKDSYFKRVSSKYFYSFLSFLTNSKYDFTVANFSISSRKLIENVNKMKEKDRLFPLLVNWLGFSIGYIELIHDRRLSTKSSYTFGKRMKLALNVILAQSNKPLIISTYFGGIIAILSFIIGIFIIIKKIFFGVPIIGWASNMVSLFFISGILLANLGIIGIYLGKIFDYNKDRPLYIIDEKIN